MKLYSYKLFERNLLIPRNIEGRKEKYFQMIYKQLQQEVVDGSLDLLNVQITNLGNVKIINNSLLLFDNKTLKSLGDLEIVNGDTHLEETNIEDLGNLKEINSLLDLDGNKTLKSLGNLERVGGYLWLRNTNIEDLGNLKVCKELWLSKDTKIPKKQYEKFNYKLR